MTSWRLPASARNTRAGGNERAIPCDLAPKGRWSEADLARIRDFAASLPADVIALQEIDGRDVAEKLFPGREFCFTKRRAVQNVGFAIRQGIRYRCNDDVKALGLPENDVRWGADLTLEPGTPREMRLLAVHLKASCNRDPLTSERFDCRLLQRQVPVLEDWIDGRAKSGDAFGVVGDFNRRFDREGKVARDAQWRDRRDVARDRRRRAGRRGPRQSRRRTTARSGAGTVSASACRSTTLFWANGWPGGWCRARSGCGIIPQAGAGPTTASSRSNWSAEMAYDKDNIFARIVRGEIPCHKVYEDADTLAFMDIMPQAEGHTLIVPKAAGEDIFTTPPESVAAAMRTAQKVARADQEGVFAAGRHGRAAERSRRGPERLSPAFPRDPALQRQGPRDPRSRARRFRNARGPRGPHPRGLVKR